MTRSSVIRTPQTLPVRPAKTSCAANLCRDRRTRLRAGAGECSRRCSRRASRDRHNFGELAVISPDQASNFLEVVLIFLWDERIQVLEGGLWGGGCENFRKVRRNAECGACPPGGARLAVSVWRCPSGGVRLAVPAWRCPRLACPRSVLRPRRRSVRCRRQRDPCVTVRGHRTGPLWKVIKNVYKDVSGTAVPQNCPGLYCFVHSGGAHVEESWSPHQVCFHASLHRMDKPGETGTPQRGDRAA